MASAERGASHLHAVFGDIINVADDHDMTEWDRSVDVIVAGSGISALTAALAAAHNGLKVLVLEKSDRLGGTSAMSGAGTWIPANHHARAAGYSDSKEEALAYLRAALPVDWRGPEDHLWAAFVDAAPMALQFIEDHTSLKFELIGEPDPFSELPGGKCYGRMLSPQPLSRRIAKPFKIRRSTMPHIFSYREGLINDFYASPIRAALRMAPTLLGRLIRDEAGQGSALISGMVRGCLDAGVEIHTSSPVVQLIADNTGAVTGVAAGAGDAQIRFEARRGVILATGGFEWDAKLLEQYFPGGVDRLGSPNTNTGDGHKMAANVGAQLDHMDQANIYPTLPTRYEGSPLGLPITYQAAPHAIIVDQQGRRFASELDFNIGEALDRRDPVTGELLHTSVHLVTDSRFMAGAISFKFFARMERGWVVKADSLAELARKISVPAQELERTVTRWNNFCETGRDADFRRGENAWERYKGGLKDGASGTIELGPITKPPFFAMRCNRSILGTKGGVRTDQNGRALRADGSVIAGLFCAGNTMANPIGTRAIGPGTTIGPCMTWGFICGNAVTASN